jgi:acyl-CoA thioesterase-1
MILISKGFNVEVFLMQIRILPNYGKRYQTQFESIYKKVSNETNTALIPFMLQDVALDKNLMLQDGIHPNEKAQPLIANFVYKSLKTYLE